MKLFQKATIIVLLIAGIVVVQQWSKDRELKSSTSNDVLETQSTPSIASEQLTPEEEEEQQLKLQFLSCKSHQ